MSTYYITAIKQETVGSHTFISHVLIHEVTNSSVSQGRVMTKGEVIILINNNHHIYSATWNYTNIGWSEQEPISTEKRNGHEYLRTSPDNSLRDNLLHLLPLENLGL